MLWNLAAANGNANAADQRAAVVRKMTHEQVEEGQAPSAKWKPAHPCRAKTGAG